MTVLVCAWYPQYTRHILPFTDRSVPDDGDEVHVILEGGMTELLAKISPETYQKYIHHKRPTLTPDGEFLQMGHWLVYGWYMTYTTGTPAKNTNDRQ